MPRRCDTTGLPPGSLKLEITESAFIDDVPGAQHLLDRARALGVAWSLDDFGTGYSSLSFLHRLQVNTVKVDRSFVSAIGPEGTGSAMVRAIVGLAHALGMTWWRKASRPPSKPRSCARSAASSRRASTSRARWTPRRRRD